MTVYAGREKTQVLIKARIIVWNLKNDDRKYPLIYPVRAPFPRSGRLFSTNSGKTSTIVLGIPGSLSIRLSGVILQLEITANSTC
jgi:hypothetical protein